MESRAAQLCRRMKETDWAAPLLIVIVVILGYGIAPTRLPLWGEETRRARHGIEMAQSGDWLVATNQGLPILDRPPLQYWVLAIIHKWVHPLDPLTLRLFMAAVVLCTSLVIWSYARAFLSGTGAFLAAVAYPTMGHVFDLGRRVETDGLFALLMAGALMVWHYGYARRWRPTLVWALGGAVAALATLTKGSQGPVTFFGTVYLFLLVRRDGRYLLRWSHVLGLVLFIGIIAIWQVPFYWHTGWEGTRMTWLDPYIGRVNTGIAGRLLHFAKFPVIVLGATLPWSVLLVGLFHRPFWKLEEAARSAVVFALLGMATVFVPVWINAGGLHRYVMPMYPLLAVVCGAVAQQCLSAPMTSSLRQFWRNTIRIVALVMAGVAVAFLMATIGGAFSDAPWIHVLAQPWLLMTALVTGVAAGVALIWRQTSPGRTEHGRLVTFTSVVLLAACFNGPILNATARNMDDVGPQIMAMRHSLPTKTRLVSFGPVFHKFLYWYEDSIPILGMPATLSDVPEDLEYFAMDVRWGRLPELPFEWEHVAAFNMGRIRKTHPEHAVVVGRRIRTR
ncbi:MAG: glycosyltransferase family 39 protein [Phycisphaerae bacterium]|nr:glycosyltransferase family 39 protein [Phycisphaerae bacterium]